MSGDVVVFSPASRLRNQAQDAPPLPIERHIVAAALTAESLRGLAEQLVLVLRHTPRNADVYSRVHDEALAAWCAMDEHYQAYRAVLECEGQA